MKKRNPPDTTFRNINALKKRVENIERCLEIFIGANVTLTTDDKYKLFGFLFPIKSKKRDGKA